MKIFECKHCQLEQKFRIKGGEQAVGNEQEREREKMRESGEKRDISGFNQLPNDGRDCRSWSVETEGVRGDYPASIPDEQMLITKQHIHCV